MIGTKCPGQDMRYWTADDACEIDCPHCGEEMEFFKTDIRLRCPNCKTRVANPRFDLGCAEWCVYAEQCLGSAAKGLKTQSLKNSLEDYLKTKLREHPAEKASLEKLFLKTENICQEQRIDMLPVLAALLALALKRHNLIKNEQELLESLKENSSWPQQALKDTQNIMENVAENKVRAKTEKLVAQMLAELEAGL